LLPLPNQEEPTLVDRTTSFPLRSHRVKDSNQFDASTMKATKFRTNKSMPSVDLPIADLSNSSAQFTAQRIGIRVI